LGEKLLLFGPPGVGKGTQARRLSVAFHIPHVATGDILRGAIQSNTPLGLRVASFLHAGKLVPDEIMVEVVTQRLAQADAASGYLLDGFPRTMAQADAIDGVIVMDGPTEALVLRIAGRRTCESCQWSYHVVSRPPKVDGVCDRCGGMLIQRVDDAEATVRFRLQEYAQKTAPVLDYFRAHHWPMLPIDAIGDIDQVFGRIYSAVLLS